VPSVTLLTGRDPQGTLYEWRVWCKDAQSNPADIGSISGVEEFNYDVKILSDTGGPGAATVHDFILNPSGPSTWASLSGGSIDTLTGKLTLKGDTTGLYGATGHITGNFEIASVDADPATGPGEYQLAILGGVWGPGSLTIGNMEAGVTAFLGPVYRGAQVDIGHVRARAAEAISSLFIADYDEAGGDIHIGEMHPGAVVTVACAPSNWIEDEEVIPACPEDPLQRCCTEVEGGLQLTVDLMHGESTEPELPGAFINHRGLYGGDWSGTFAWESLSVGSMQYGASIYCDTVAGTLRLLGGIPTGAVVELGSVGYSAFELNEEHGIVDLSDQPIAGTLLVNKFGATNRSIAGQIVNGGPVSGTVTISGDISATGSVALGDVSGVVNVGTLTPGHDVLSGELAFGDLSGTLNVYGGVTSGGTITTDDVASGGDALVLGALAGSFTVGGTVAGEVHVTGNVSGPLTVAGDVSGTVQCHGDLSQTISVEGSLACGGVVKVDDNLTGNGKIDVTGIGSGEIRVQGAMTVATTMVKVRGGLDSHGRIYVNSSGDSSSITAGTIWIGGSTQNPLPLTLDGKLGINCSSSPGTYKGLLKVVGCSPVDEEPIDVYVGGANLGTFQLVDLPCTNHFYFNYLSSCPPPPSPCE
jgi:hypothetical protein